MHTPEQARELWCPMVRIARREEWHEASGTAGKPETQHELHIETIVGGCNTDALGRNRVPASCRCIADQCAMWRWGEWKEGTELQIVDCAIPHVGIVKQERQVPVRIPVKGYCGIAGRPEVA